METKEDIYLIDNVELFFLKIEDYYEIKSAMKEVYSNMSEPYWDEEHIRTLIKKFRG